MQDEANLYLGILFFSISAMLFNNWAEFAIITERLPVFYKQVAPRTLALTRNTLREHLSALHCSTTSDQSFARGARACHTPSSRLPPV